MLFDHLWGYLTRRIRRDSNSCHFCNVRRIVISYKCHFFTNLGTVPDCVINIYPFPSGPFLPVNKRSEERRVGKESRSSCFSYQSDKQHELEWLDLPGLSQT